MFPNPRHIPWILGALAFAMAPQALRVPAWIGVGCLLCWGYLLGVIYRGWPLPGRLTRMALTLGGVAGVVLTTGPGFDRQTGLALFAVTAALKPMEIRSFRDEAVSLFMGYFLVLTGLFFSGSLVISLHMLASVFVITAVLIRVNHPGGTGSGHLRLAGIIILQALPVAAVLFVLFPRIQGNLWRFSRPTAGITGFSDRMSPGDVSSLVLSRDVAFRAEFEGPIPPKEQLYWRGIVFRDFDGRTWRQGQPPAKSKLLAAGKPIAYSVTLEPHQQRWLFALDLPVDSGTSLIRRGDFTVVSPRPVRERIRYRLTSSTVYRTTDTPREASPDRAIAPWTNPLAFDLGRQWAGSDATPAQIVKTALTFFETSGFVYTLNAPALGRAPVDQFLFETRSGYCEHYASAFAYLMRSAGLACRVVGGYLGGERNPFGDYLILRQSDAHAWVEVLLPGNGWVRIDPTSVVAPARISQGAVQALPPAEVTARMRLWDYGPLTGLVRSVQLGWDAANNRYHRWVTGYSFQRQKRLLARLGIKPDSRFGPLAAALLAAGLACALGYALYRRPPTFRFRPRDPVGAAYRSFCTKLARAGLPKPPARGPMDHAEETIQARPDLAPAVRHIIDLYVRLRYAPNPQPADLKALLRAVRGFKPSAGPTDPK
ncbi:MAG: DUF3488 domain-containing transglutaminase family protein [Desulfobacterales bacterium]|nr:DUF3488 domain-containing transglutaminase family protein [Desulfobacterales bacterium]